MSTFTLRFFSVWPLPFCWFRFYAILSLPQCQTTFITSHIPHEIGVCFWRLHLLHSCEFPLSPIALVIYNRAQRGEVSMSLLPCPHITFWLILLARNRLGLSDPGHSCWWPRRRPTRARVRWWQRPRATVRKSRRTEERQVPRSGGDKHSGGDYSRSQVGGSGVLNCWNNIKTGKLK